MGKNKRMWGFVLGLWLATAQAGVVVEELPSLPVGGVGIQTDLKADIWGQNLDDIISQLRDIADSPLNAMERAILRQVVLTEITQGIPSEEEGLALLKERVHVLKAQGLFEDILSLTDRIPASQNYPEVQRYRAEALFALGRATEACADEFLTAFSNDEAFVRAVCAAATQDPDRAALAFDVYRENNENAHPFFEAAGDVMYRLLPAKLPEGQPSIWEWPLVARAFGEQVFSLVRNRGDVLVLARQDQVPHAVRIWAEKQLNHREQNEQAPDGQILKHLKAWAEARRALEKSLPPAYQKWGKDVDSAH